MTPIEAGSEITVDLRRLETRIAAAPSIIDVLDLRAAAQADRTAYIFLEDGEQQESRTTYGELARRVRAIASVLQQRRLTGERVLLVYGPGLEYIAAFLGCLSAGVVAVPIYPPSPSSLRRPQSRIPAVLSDAAPAAILTLASQRALVEGVIASLRSKMAVIASDEIPSDAADQWTPPVIDANTLAFLQYTSGSTSSPKGVMVTHGNILHNERQIQAVCRHTGDSTFVGWLPFYHDMGLIGNVMQPLYLGAPAVLMSPIAFLTAPVRWLRAISHYRGVTSGGPNFAYELCVQKIALSQVADLDLRSWRIAFNGAEPIRARTMTAFAEKFAACGFQPDAFLPCYGLAEGTLMAAAPRHGRFAVTCVDAQALQQQQIVLLDDATSPAGRSIVGCGPVIGDQQVAIVDPGTGRRCRTLEVGEIWIAGPSIAAGYWNRPDESQATFGATLESAPGARFLRTGDLGFLLGDDLHITGRAKDLIIIRGRNFYPQDIEATVERSSPIFRRGCAAAFAVDADAREQLVVVQEVERQYADAADPHADPAIADALRCARAAVAVEHGVHIDQLVLVPPGRIPKTSSGKIQRGACRRSIAAGELEVVATSTATDDLGEIEIPATGDLTRACVWAYIRAHVGRLTQRSRAEIDEEKTCCENGMDSLGATELRHVIGRDLGVAVPIEVVLGETSLDALVDLVLTRARLADTATTRVPAATPEAWLPVTSGQASLWFLHQHLPQAGLYHVTLGLQIDGALDAAALLAACDDVIARHESLRTTFAKIEGEPRRKVLVAGPPDTARDTASVDATGWDASRLIDAMQAEARRPFDLESGPLVRTRLYASSPQVHHLLLVVHHLVADLWSLGLLFAEIERCYEARRQGQEPALPPPAVTFEAYVARQQRWIARDSEPAWTYWARELEGPLPVLSLRQQRARPELPSGACDAHHFSLSRSATEGVRALAAATGTTPFVILLAAFQTLLARFSTSRDVIVGVPTFGRDDPSFADIVGYCVNPLALRTRISGGERFRDLIERVRRHVLEAMAHQDMPFAEIVKRLRPDREGAHPPVYQAMLVYQRIAVRGDSRFSALTAGHAQTRVPFADLHLARVPLDPCPSELDLTLMLAEAGDRLVATLQYSRDLYGADDARAIAASFETLLAAAVDRPDTPVAALPLIDDDTRRAWVVDWNETSTTVEDAWVDERIAAQAHARPDAIAIECDGASWTYAALDRQATRVAQQLRAMGVGRASVVAVCLEPSLALVVGLLAVWKAGAAYVPLEPSDPPARLAFLVTDSRAAVVITEATRTVSWPAGVRPLTIDDPLAASERDAESDEATWQPMPRRAGDLAYVIYTSGSTGTPKGVLVTHGGLRNYIAWAMAQYDVTPATRTLLHTSTSFDLAVTSLWVPLAAGGTVVVGRGPAGAALIDALRQERLGLVKLTPAHLALVEQSDVPHGAAVAVVGGEALSAAAAHAWVRRSGPGARLYNEYGPTETVVGSSISEASHWAATGAAPIGRPIANTQMYVLDEALMPVPIGVPGALYIGGAGLARGYLGAPALTASRFVPDPFGEGGRRLYRTGDRACYRADGELEYLGRVDTQVKLRGYRVEPGEVEAVLQMHPLVAQAVVVPRASAGGLQMAAYLVARTATTQDTAAVRAHAMERLPEYLVPTAWVWLDALPLTSHGKVDRARLPAPATPAVSDGWIAPQTDIEQQLATLWSEVLQVERVGLHDNFFQLGGHSLLIIQVAARMADLFGVKVSVRDFFAHPTVAALAGFVTAAIPADDRSRHERLASRAAGRAGSDLSRPGSVASVVDDDGEATAQATTIPTTVSSCGLVYAPATRDRVLVLSRVTGATTIVDREDADLLRACAPFASIDQHAGTQAARDGNGSREAIIARLRRLTSKRLLVGQAEALDAAATIVDSSPRPPRGPLETIACLTKDRPALVARALASYIENSREFGRRATLLVSDHSSSRDTAAQTFASIRALVAETGARIVYAGSEQREQLAAQLADRTGAPPAIVRFALFGSEQTRDVPAPGANRNAVLLVTAGESLVMVDDDTVCRARRMPRAQGVAARVLDGGVPVEYWVHAERRAALNFGLPTAVDFIGLHDDLLGTPVVPWTRAQMAAAACELEPAALEHLLRAGPRATVSMTSNAIVGDCGWGFPAHLFLRGASLRRLTASEAIYAASCTSREMTQGASVPTLSRRPDWLMSGFLGLGRTSELPPFLPIGRGEDHLFGTMAAAADRDGYVAHIPWAFEHLPGDLRTFSSGEVLRRSSGIDLLLLFDALVGSADLAARDTAPAESLRRMGRHLQAIGSLRRQDFLHEVRASVWRRAQEIANRVDHERSAFEQVPEYWARDVDRFLDTLTDSAIRAEFPIPTELLYGASLDEATTLTQEIVSRFGSMLTWWPDLMAAARELRQSGALRAVELHERARGHAV